VGFGFVSSGSWKFRDSHLTRALKATKKAGFSVDKAVITARGDIELKFGNGNGDTSDNDEPNPWDVVHAAKQKRTA
jgi:hypothetical protein